MRSVWLGLLAVGVACGGGGDDRPGLPSASGATSTGGARNQAGSATGATAGAGARTGDGGAASADGGAADAGGDATAGTGLVFEVGGAPPDYPPGVCKPAMMLGSEQAQDVGAQDVTLLAMTGDELSVAFTTGDANAWVLHVADRSSTQKAFGEVAVTLPPDYDAGNGATLSSDGLRLVLTEVERGAFGQLVRAKRGDAFAGDIDTAPFATINSLKPTTGDSLGWPLLSADGKDLYYVRYSSRALVAQCRLGNDQVFDIGKEIDEFTLGGSQGEHKLLSGLSADGRAIFFFDEKSGHAMALFRQYEDSPFYDPLDLGARRGAVPNAGCDHVYSSVAAGIVAQPVK